MRKSQYEPMNPATEIDRLGIKALSGASKPKVMIVTKSDKWGFPKITRRGTEGVFLYDLAEVVAWLSANNLAKMLFSGADRKPTINDEPRWLNNEFSRLKIGIKPKKFTGTGKSKTVRIKGHDDYPEPRQYWQCGSHNAEHRVSVSI